MTPLLDPWSLFLTGALACNGVTSAAAGQATAMLDALDARQAKLEPDEQQAWVAFAVGALAGLGVASKAIVQADLALGAWKKRVPPGRDSEPVRLEAVVGGKVVGSVALAPTASASDADGSADGLRLVTPDPEPSIPKPTGVVPEIPSTPTFDPIPSPFTAGPTPNADPVVAQGGVTVTTHGRTITEARSQAEPRLPKTDPAWATLLSCMTNENVAERIIESWPTAGLMAKAMDNVDTASTAVMELARVLDGLSSRKNYNPERKARTVQAFAKSYAEAKRALGPIPVSLEALAKLPGVDQRVLDGYQLLVLGELTEKRPEDERLGGVWDEMSKNAEPSA